MDIQKSNSTVAKIMEGGLPSVAELAEMAPLLKIAKACIAKVEEHIKERLESGEEISGARLKKGAERRDITSANKAFWSLKDELGCDFDQKAWADIVKVSAADAQKFLIACGVEKKEARTKLAELLGDNLVTKENKPSLEIK